jgi:hypothetical protein
VRTSKGLRLARELKVGDFVLTTDGDAPIIRIDRPTVGEWVEIRCGDRPLIVTPTHRFVDPSGELIAAGELRLGQILASDGRNVEVTGLRLFREAAEAVALELDAPHLYFIDRRGPLSHNPKP